MAGEEYMPLEGEVYLNETYRKPELDHIIPYILGGDGDENLQILCRSCNCGKGESLSSFFRDNGLGLARINTKFSLTPAMRYIVIANLRREIPLEECVESQRQIRVFKKNQNGLCLIDNLVARFC